jgi:anti-sigma factor RsiW
MRLSSSTVSSAQDLVLREAVSSHIRSLMVTHLADIATSDQHTVKPWFQGKLDFSPAVVDHAADGFPLTGGRLDYVAGRPVAAVVYQRRAHVINLFTCPDGDAKASDPKSVLDRGYNAVTWSDGSMKFCAVSDVSGDELMNFVALVRGESKPGP